MSQHNLIMTDVNTDTSPEFRAELNLGLAAIASNNSSVTAPPNPINGQRWANEQDGYMYQYYNDSWVKLWNLTTGDIAHNEYTDLVGGNQSERYHCTPEELANLGSGVITSGNLIYSTTINENCQDFELTGLDGDATKGIIIAVEHVGNISRSDFNYINLLINGSSVGNNSCTIRFEQNATAGIMEGISLANYATVGTDAAYASIRLIPGYKGKCWSKVSCILQSIPTRYVMGAIRGVMVATEADTVAADKKLSLLYSNNPVGKTVFTNITSIGLHSNNSDGIESGTKISVYGVA